MLPFALLLTSTLVWPGLPEQLPTSWRGSYPSGLTAAPDVFGATLTIAGLTSILAALVALVRAFIPSLWSRWVVTTLATVSAGAVAGYGLTAWATHLAGDPAQVHVLWALAAIVVALGFGVVAYVVHGRTVPQREVLVEQIPERSRVVPTPAGGPTAWSADSGSALLTGMSVFVAVAFAVCVVALVVGGSSWAAVAVALPGAALFLLALAWSAITVVVDEQGLRVRSRRVPVTVLTVRPGQVLGVEVLDLDPMKWGGYGLRGTPGRTAYIVTGGDGLVVHRANGTRLALEITEGEPREGAAALLRVAGQALAGAGSFSG